MNHTFPEPHELYDAMVAREEAAYRKLTEGKTCGDCANCKVPPAPSMHGWCVEKGEFVVYDELDVDCEAFE